MKKVFKFVKGKKDEKKESGGITPSQSGELLSPAQTPEDERFLGLDNSSGYIVDFCGKDKTLTKLHKAAWQGSLEKLKSALKKVEIDAVDRHNRTALHFAVVQGHPNIVWFLLGNNAKTAVCDDEGRTPLLKAIECGHKECMTLLLERGTDINVADYTGNTGLHIATTQGSLDTASVLLKKGADTEVSNNAGDYPLHIATKLENKDLVDLFLEHGASVDVLDRENRTPLMLAAKTGNLLLAQLFFERGAQPTIVDSNGWTAHDYALLSGYESVAASLKKLIDGKKLKAEPKISETRIEEEGEAVESSRSNENSGTWSESKTEASDKDPITQKLKEFFKKCSEDGGETDKEKGEDSSDSPNADVMPPFCRPPRSWDMIQAGMIYESKEGAEAKRRSITTLGTLHSRRESFTEGLTNISPKYTLSLNRRKHAKVNNSFAKQRFSFNEEESLKYWMSQDKTIRKDLEKIEMENISNLEAEVAVADSGRRRSASESDWDSDAVTSEEADKPTVESDSGTLGRNGTMHGVEEMWVVNPHLTPPEHRSSWDSDKEGSFPPPPTGLELGVDMAKSIKYMKGVSEDHPVGGAMERNLWKNAYESHSLDCLEEKDFAEPSKIVFKGHARHESTSSQKWRSEEIPKCQKPCDRLIDVNRRINEQLECYDQALRELAETSKLPWATHNYHSLPSSRSGDFDEGRRTSSLNRRLDKTFVDSGPFSMPFSVNTTPPQDAENNEAPGPEPAKTEPVAMKSGEKLEKKTKRHMLLAMRDIKHAVHVANTFKTSQDDQILSPLTKPENSFDADDKLSPKEPLGSEGNSPADENPFFGIGRQETVMERNDFRRKSSSSGTGDEPTLWLQDEAQKKTDQHHPSDDNISDISEEEAVKHKRTSSFSPLGIVYREIEKESQGGKKTLTASPIPDSDGPAGSPSQETFPETFNGGNQEVAREPSPDVSLSSGPIEPLGTEKDSGSEPESSHNDVTPTRNYSLKAQHEWLKSHLKAATSEKSKLEEMTAQLSEKTERLQYELADAKEAAKSRDEVIHLLQGQLARMEAAYTKSLEESVHSRLQLTSHEQEILHLKELCYKYEEEKENATAEAVEELGLRIKALEEEKKKMKEKMSHLEEEKCLLEKRLKEAAESELIDQCQRWKERCEELGEMTKAYDSQKSAYETYVKDLGSEHLTREREMMERNSELEKKLVEASEENSRLKSKVQNLAGELESERKRSRRESNESALKRKNAETEQKAKNLEREVEERVVKKLKEKEEEVQGLVSQLNKEREALVLAYEKKMMERRRERNEEEAEKFRRENEGLRQMIARLQEQVASIQVRAPDGNGRESLKEELSELRFQCNVVMKSLAEMQSRDAQEINAVVAENFQLKKDMNELKVKMIRDDGRVPPNFKSDLLAVVSENAKMENEIWELKGQVNSLTLLLDRRLSVDSEDRRLQSGSGRSGRRREVGKEDELAWSNLYGIKRTRRSRGERTSGGEGQEECPEGGDSARKSPYEFLELKKEILSLQNKMSDEKSLRHALESQLVEMNFDLKEKENLQQEIHSLKRKIDRDCVQRSELELVQYQKELESKWEKYLERGREKGGDEEYRARCETLAKEREKCKELRYKKSKSFDPGGASPSFPPPPVKYHSYPLTTQLGVVLQPDAIPSLGLEPDIKIKLEEELDRSIKKYLNESSSSQSIPSVQIELLKQKYIH